MIRQLLTRLVRDIPENPAIAASGGIDSSSLVIAALDAGLAPTVVSFSLDSHESQDFRAARALARTFSLPFLPVRLPTQEAVILADVHRLIHQWGARRKTAIEVCWPWLYMVPALQAEGFTDLITGLTADGHFALTKKDAIHNRGTRAAFQRARHDFFSNPDAAQKRRIAAIGTAYSVSVHVPYAHPDVFALWLDATWDELNRPRQIEALRSAFPELDPLRIKPHSDMQLGDSGIAELIGETARRRYAPDMKSPIAAYNRIAQGR